MSMIIFILFLLILKTKNGFVYLSIISTTAVSKKSLIDSNKYAIEHDFISNFEINSIPEILDLPIQHFAYFLSLIDDKLELIFL